ncbi:PREDICTED: ATP-dependent RNA helicase SUV3, mitochondrial isoform X4 [Brassica oleracea var. oleracea]|uniref:ATP-dependent RNA helicase SUV3, mitochondrial isoform X4 n=1 Tax=Brassica oleracea var. oleracea TaxID=109376 RepID=UPI0006A75245|nr:PREDICTED: ATP-dependent RNA helicase SUV3, mitochondrial isoform X4 [Brassica oleracea var. oleracea]
MIIELFCKEQLILVYFIQSILHKIIKMAYSLLRIRKVSPFRISRVLQGVFTRNYGKILGSSNYDFTGSEPSSSFDFTDLTCPHTWYPIARRKKRKVILHVGPTNSGKTYNALKQLERSSSGVYCGPLRLLAWEVAKRLNKANVPCDLITGQEKELVEGANHKAVTVEMADVTSVYDCAIIDEIQMVGCKQRGFSFTRALLGIAANELHLCGDPAVVPLVEDILKVTGDDVEVLTYERLSPLVPLKVPVRSVSDIKTGDCLVTFSRKDIYRHKNTIEKAGKHLCSVVYGSLPPETRTAQATRFNDATNDFDVLVASDAIGMGLNLNISRIIFSTLEKFDGTETRDLTVSEIKQIAGRAGRFRSQFPVGEVTCLHKEDLPLLHSSLKSPSPIIERAGLFPTYDLLSRYSQAHPKLGLYKILEHFVENAKLSSNYFISNVEDMMKAAALVDELPLKLQDKYLFVVSLCFCSPVDINDEISGRGFAQFAQNYSKTRVVKLREILSDDTVKVPRTPTELKELESIHKVLDLYVWLSLRLEDSFPDREVAASQKSICNVLIEQFLEANRLISHIPFSSKKLRSRRKF